MAKLAYSYLRFSCRIQERGDSIRRQTELRDAWVARNKATLDTSVSLTDAGVSAFRGKNATDDTSALRAFLNLVESGRIPAGSYLLVENLDRLSRQQILPALELFLGLLRQGIRIVQLSPETVFDGTETNPQMLMIAIMELSRGHSESALKSQRVSQAWEAKRRRADRQPMTARCPFWLRLDKQTGRFVVVEKWAAIVRRVFTMHADEGKGCRLIAQRLNKEGVKPVGGKLWLSTTIARLLRDEKVLGKLQTYKGRKPIGEAVEGYYPPIIDEATFYRARGVASNNRKAGGGRPAKQGNLFTGLLFDARSGSTFQLRSGNPSSLLVPYTSINGGADSYSVSYATFEQVFLRFLSEVNPADLLPAKRNKEGDKLAALSGRLADLDGRVTALQEKLLSTPDFKSGFDLLQKLETERKKVADDLQAAKVAAVVPGAEAIGESVSLAALVASSKDETIKARLRQQLRNVIESVWLYILPVTKQRRYLVTQVFFKNSPKTRIMVIEVISPNGTHGKPASWRMTGIQGDISDTGGNDLRESHAWCERAISALFPLHEARQLQQQFKSRQISTRNYSKVSKLLQDGRPLAIEQARQILNGKKKKALASDFIGRR